MENASKALLIAGAILLVIAIIAVGMGIFGTTRGAINNAEGQIDNMSIQMHNNQFEQYEGQKLEYATVKECVAQAASNNSKAAEAKFKVGVRTYRISDGHSCNHSSNVHSILGCGIFGNKNNTYNIVLEYNTNGIINYILVQQN